jgi:hypothetical protein
MFSLPTNSGVIGSIWSISILSPMNKAAGETVSGSERCSVLFYADAAGRQKIRDAPASVTSLRANLHGVGPLRKEHHGR